MTSKTLAVVLGAVTAVSAAIVGARHFGGSNIDPAQSTGSATSSGHATGAAQARSAGAGQHTNAGSLAGAHPNVDDHHTAGENNGTSGGPTRHGGVAHRQDRVRNGNYATIIAGSFTGTGNADVKDDKVSIKARVTAADGRSGEFIANNLMFDGPYFHGNGTVLGDTVQVNGRLDAARASRLTATFSDLDGKLTGRVVGSLPAGVDAGDDNWDGDATRAPR